jgi:tyrosyl-tRNA synthetase
MRGLKRVFEQFDIRFGDGETDAVIVNNEEWIGKLSAMDLLSVAQYFSVNRMLTFDSVKLRLEREHHLSLKEFLYMVIQAYDFVELYERHECRLQLGGSDQWGNIVSGIELFRKKQALEESQQAKLFGLTTPLITLASGAKMGKTADGAVWLTQDRFSSYDYWQFWRNVDDADVGRFLKLFTDLPREEILRLEALEGAAINEAKIVLANEATRICHGQEAAMSAQRTAREVFERGGLGDALPVVEVAAAELKAGIPAYKLLQLAGLCQSGGEARRLVQGGGAKLNDNKIEDSEQVITLDAVTAEGSIKLSSGKKKHALVKPA